MYVYYTQEAQKKQPHHLHSEGGGMGVGGGGGKRGNVGNSLRGLDLLRQSVRAGGSKGIEGSPLHSLLSSILIQVLHVSTLVHLLTHIPT